MTPIQPDQPLSVTLQAQEWNTVMAGLYELPAKLSVAVIGRLQEQFAAQAARRQQAENGVQVPETT